MVVLKLVRNGVYLLRGSLLVDDAGNISMNEINSRLTDAGLNPMEGALPDKKAASKGTIASGILQAHNVDTTGDKFKIHFDALASHDITYVGIIETAIASGMKKFPIPYVLTNCHNSLCAVGGTINEDDHVFGLSAAKKFGGEFVPAHMAVIHSYVREMMAGCGKMILGSDSHTRYGALGTMGIGEGGPELVKQLLSHTYDFPRAEIIAVYLKGSPRPGVGPQDVALALIGTVFKDGFVKNKVLEFVGPGVSSLPVEFRNGIDVMTTETACLSSIWRTDDRVKKYFEIHGRPGDYRQLDPEQVAWYDGAVIIDLDKVKPMIALPFHPSNVYTIDDLNENAKDILEKVENEASRQIENPNLSLSLADKIHDGRLCVNHGVIAGCAGGTPDNIVAAAQILKTNSSGIGEFSLSVYPGSQPIKMELVANGSLYELMSAGATVRTAFCGPCFGACDTPANNGLSIRHTTRNFPNREGSKPNGGQLASVALMDARSIAATAANNGVLTSAEKYGEYLHEVEYTFRKEIYDKKVYRGFGKPRTETELIYGPNICPWPKVYPLAENLMLSVASVITDPVTTTDELIPSGETSSLRSNPLKLAEYALSRKDPGYVGRAKAAQALESARRKVAGAGLCEIPFDLKSLMALTKRDAAVKNTGIGSVIFAVKPGDGSAREQAASSQKVLGGQANIAEEYATKRYRSNLINWGMIPFIIDPADKSKLMVGDWLFVPDIRKAVQEGLDSVTGIVIRGASRTEITLKMPGLTKEDRDIILAGCLMNYYSQQNDQQSEINRKKAVIKYI
jgi:aconitate hydratase